MTKQSKDIFGKDAKAVEAQILNTMGANENDNVLDGWSCEDGDKKITLKPLGMYFDGKMTEEALSVEREGTKYNNVYGDRIGITIERNEKHFQKLVEIHSLEALNIPEGAEYLEFSFAVSDFDLPNGEIKEKIKFGENSFIEPIKAWDTTESESGAFGVVKDNVITKKIPVNWLKTAKFPVKTDIAITYGGASSFQSGESTYVSVAALDSTHFVVCWKDVAGSSHGSAMVGSISGTTITFGAENEFNADTTNYISVAAIDSTHFIVTYQNGGSSAHGEARIGLVSGNTISSYGTVNDFNADTTYENQVSVLDSTHFVVAYRNGGSSSHGYAVVGVMSGTTISSYGTPNRFLADTASYFAIETLDSTHFMIAYKNPLVSNKGYAVIGSVSTTTISYGTAVVFHNDTLGNGVALSLLDSTHVVAAYIDAGASNKGYAVVGVFSGTTISSWGTQVEINASTTKYIDVAVLDSSTFISTYNDDATGEDGTGIVGTVSGTTITKGSEYAFYTSATYYTAVSKLDAYSFAISYARSTASGYSVIGTIPSPPVVPSFSAISATNVTPTTAVGNATITDEGFTITERGWVVGTSTAPTTADDKFTTTGTDGAYVTYINGLTENTLYYARPFVTTTDGTPTTAYGAEESFTTGIPYVVTTAGAKFEFDTQNAVSQSNWNIDANHYINFWQGFDNDGFVQVMEVDTSTWAITTANSPLEYDTQSGEWSECYKVDDNHFINFWNGAPYNGFCQMFEVDTSTWAVTTAADTLEYEASGGTYNSCYQIDANHFINFWSGTDSDGFAQVFEVNTSTWVITTSDASLEFDTDTFAYSDCSIIDSNHFVLFWAGAWVTDHYAAHSQVFEVNTSTWVVTTAGADFEYHGQTAFNKCWQVDENHFINFFQGTDYDGLVQIMEINTSTWAITTSAATLEFDTQNDQWNSCYQIDSNHFINFWVGFESDEYVQTFEVNTSTWAVTTASAFIEFDTQQGKRNACCQIDSSHFVNSYQGVDDDGWAQVFEVALEVTAPSFDGAATVTAVTKTTATGNGNILTDNGFTITERGWVVAETTAPTTGDSKFTTAGTEGEYESSFTGLTEGTLYYARPFATTSDGTPTTTYGTEVEFTTLVNWAVTTAGAVLGVGAQGFYNGCHIVDENHFINFWEDTDGQVQIFEVNTSTWAVTTAATSLTVTGNMEWNSPLQIDTNHFINFYEGVDSDGFAQVFEINTSTWAITTASAVLEFDTQNNLQNSSFVVDSNHFINFWGGIDGDGFAQIFEVNTSTWAVTTANASLEFETQEGEYHACFQVDSNHFIDFWASVGADGFVQIFDVNTSTWAITTAGASLEFDTQTAQYNSCYQIDSNHFINFWKGVDSDGFAQVFEINTSTWAITTASAVLEFDTDNCLMNSCTQVDSNHFINVWRSTGVTGSVQVFEVDTSTWAITTAVAPLGYTTSGSYPSICSIDTGHFINFFHNDSQLGVQAFAVELPDAAGGGDDTIFFSCNF